MAALDFLAPEWQVPPKVRAVVTTRSGGVSTGAYASLNLATHVGDDAEAVVANRRRLRDALALPAEPAWLEQVHGSAVATLSDRSIAPAEPATPADGVVAFGPGVVCAVLVADCLPVFVASADGDRVGIAHAGWRGLAGGVVEATTAALDCDPARLVAWLGPSIGPQAFEVGEEVRAAFMAGDPDAAGAFTAGRDGRWYADLPALARRRLQAAGLRSIHGGDLCTYSNPRRFFSYRRDGRTGRMAALAWLA